MGGSSAILHKGQYFPARIGSDSFDSKRRNVSPGESEATH